MLKIYFAPVLSHGADILEHFLPLCLTGQASVAQNIQPFHTKQSDYNREESVFSSHLWCSRRSPAQPWRGFSHFEIIEIKFVY